ncbi:hypothetical protein [Hamadaea tsunoensis]|uniref:hypothetical protein n=1 Tax=Hamadaea tsunoensis TaxID=53368 RepID=UPI00040806AE|nr:hypothetical protein [Hamadaea tsunoensis]
MYRTVLSQLIDADEFAALTPDELRELVLKLDEQIMFSTSEVVDPYAESTIA